jgi:RNA polymerase sigma-70 factor (ECF subfamily)
MPTSQSRESPTATAETFNEYRPYVFSIAYRMLGSVMDAEDMLQETFIRWERAPRDDVRSPKSYLATTVTRLCIDQLRSARKQREEYIGPWLPEPLITDDETARVDEHLAMSDSLSLAFLVMLESLSPTERAAFLLREAFDYDYPEIARIVEKSEANCRQLVRRARQRVSERAHRFDVSLEQAERITERFLQAVSGDDMNGLLELLSKDVVLYSDGGGKVAAGLNPIFGAEKVARLLMATARNAPEYAYRVLTVNGQPGVAIYVDGEPQGVLAAELDGDTIMTMYAVMNPNKLKNIPRLQG